MDDFDVVSYLLGAKAGSGGGAISPKWLGDTASANDLQSDLFGIYSCTAWTDTPESDRYKNGVVVVIPRQQGTAVCFQLYFSLDPDARPLFVRSRTSGGSYTNWKSASSWTAE